MDEKHCPTCICGRRAPVQSEGPYDGKNHIHGKHLPAKGPGSVTWEEHLLAWSKYAASYGTQQSAERMAERGGFGYWEITDLLGHEPKTWAPRRMEGT